MLGIKIFDNDSEDLLNSNLSFCMQNHLALEIAFYNEKEDFFMNFLQNNLLFQQIKNKSIHLDYRRYIGGEIENPIFMKAFLHEIDVMKKLNIQHAVLHYQKPSTFQNHLKQLENDCLLKNLSLLYEVSNEHDIFIYIENTFIVKSKSQYNDLFFHQIIWNTIIEMNFQDRIGICLDFGHVKCFSNDSIEDWLEYCKVLKQKNMKIYMHIHDNDGIKDLHESLPDAIEKKISDMTFIQALKDYQPYFSNDVLILENNSHIAIESYHKLKKILPNL